MTRYACIVADPPWTFRDQGSRAAPAFQGRHYRVLPHSEILAAGAMVRAVAAPDAFLFLWAPNALVLDGTATRVCDAWGFAAKQLIPWIKTSRDGRPVLGMGHYTRVASEMLVLARRGRPRVLRRDIPGVVVARRGRHSAKPDASYALIESLCDGPRLELYARRRYSPQWVAWGNQAPEVEHEA